MKSTPKLRFSLANKSKRLILLTLISLVAVAALLSFAVSASKANRAAKARAELAAHTKSAINPTFQNDKQPNAPAAAVIVATLTDNTAAATKIAPGANINYTATITNNGAASPADDATNLNFSAPLDANTTLVAGSVHASPLAANDTYNWVGNTQLDTAARALPAVTANDIAVNAPAGTDTFTVTAIAGGATALAGVVTLASPSGAFTYTPPLGRPNIADGATVQDSFTYTITNSADPSLTSTGTVRINLTGRVWYLQAGAAGDGRSNTPSSSPAAMSTAADKSTDFFYIFSNAGSLNGPFSIDAGQQLLGQGVNLVVSAITLFTAAAPTPTTTNTAGSCVSLAGAPGNNTLSGFNIGNCTGGTAITGANVGTLNVSTVTINTNGGALDLTGVGAPTVSVVLGGTTSTGGTKNVNLVGLNGTITLAGGALSGASNNAFDLTGAGTANISYSGTITNTAAARLINISGKTGGTVAFSGAVSGTGSSTGINLATNIGATINFTGGINLNAASAGFAATGGGTVSATQNNTTIVNTITTTTGTALNVSSTTIGGSGMTFRSISSNGAANGILLNATGAGGLTVTGNGGSCTTAGTCTGGAIQNSTQDAIKLTSANSISLTDMFLFSSAQSNVDATSVTGLTLVRIFSDLTTAAGILGSSLTNLTITNGTYDRGGAGSVPCNVNGVDLTNLLGTSTVTGALFKRSNTIQFKVLNNTATNFGGTPDQLTVSNTNWNTHTNACAGDHLSVGSDTGGNFRLIVNNSIGGNVFKSSGIAVQAASFGTNGKMDAQVSNITSGGNTGGAGNADTNTAGVVLGQTGTGTLTFNVHDNTTLGTGSVGIKLTHASGGGTSSGRIENNSITHIAGPGTDAMGLDLQGVGAVGGTSTIVVKNNTITGNYQRGIKVQCGQGNPQFNVTLDDNHLTGTDTTGNALQQIDVEAGLSGAGSASTMRLNMLSNDVVVGPGAIYTASYRLINRAGNTFELQDIAANPTAAQVQSWVTSAPKSNTTGGGTVSVTATAAFSASAGPIPTAFLLAPRRRQPYDFRDSIAQVQTPPTHHILYLPFEMVARSGKSSNTNAGIDTTVAELAKVPLTTTPVIPISSKVRIASVLAKATPKASASEIARIYRSERMLSHHAIRKNAFSQDPNAPTAGEVVTLNTIATFPAAGKSITIKYSATVNTTALTARQATTQGTITANAGAINVVTTDPGPPAAGATVTLLDTTLTWTGDTSTDWNDAANWDRPVAVQSSYAPGVSNPAVNDVVIPNVGAQPTISATDIGIYSLNLSNGRTLTITNPRVLTVGGSPGGDLTLDGIISGGFLNLGTGTHVINNAGGTGSLSSTNVATVLSGGTVTLNNNLQAGALAVNAGGSMNITSRTLSLNGSGAALVIPGGATFTTTGSTVIFNGTAAQTAAGIAYNNLTINNTIGTNITGVTLTGNATINGALALTSSDLATGAFTLTQPNTTLSTGVSDVVGTVIRSGGPFAAAVPLTFGNPDNRITFSAAGTRPTSVTVTMAKAAPATYLAAVQRNYNISQVGGVGFSATLRLHYLDSELNGNSETPDVNFNFRKGPNWSAVVPTARNVVGTTDGWLENNAVTSFSQWTFAALAPTASGGTVTGRIVDQSGNPVEGAVVRLEGTQNRKFITDANGFYRFDNVETNGFYTVTPSRANYSFTPSVRSFSQIGESTEAGFGATLSTSNLANPLDTPEYFVRQHYVDFLNREPDEAGFNFWSDQIIGCGPDQNCFERRRENVSAAFFLSIEFQRTGGLVDGLYRAAYGARPDFAHFLPDTRTVGLGVQVNKDGWEDLLETNTAAFVNSFVNRPEFHQVYDTMDNSLYVDTIISHTGVAFTSAERDALLTMTRAEALRSVAENSRFVSAKFNETFVMMEYFGYLRRDADAPGFAFWLNKLSEFDGNFERAEMVKAFIVSGEYRDRFPR